MVLQRDRPLPIWGWADPGEDVTVKLDEATATAKADAQGDWKVVLPAVKADGKAHSMTISGKNKIELDDILIGDVWIGSGQSNMEFRSAATCGGKEAVAAAELPADPPAARREGTGARTGQGHRGVQRPQAGEGPAGTATGTGPAWKVCTPQNVPSFSAVLYYFGQRLHKDLGVPVGLINSSWGGSPHRALDGRREKGGGMYNGMIAPVKPLAIRGVIWYQGETNVDATA